MNRRGARRWIVAEIGLAAAHPRILDALPGPLSALAVAAVVFLLPATGWLALLPRARRIEVRLARAMAISALSLAAILVAFRLLGRQPERELVWAATFAVTNAGLFAAAFRGSARPPRSLTRQETRMAGLLFLCGFALYYQGATRVVPPQVDHDLEVQATGWPLLTRFEPLLLTDRHTVYYFAHPPLLHFYTAASFLYHGALPRLEFFDAASARARDSREGRPLAAPEGAAVTLEGTRHRVLRLDGDSYLLRAEQGEAESRVGIEEVELARIYERYRQEPHLLETRTPNLFLASATVALLGILAHRICRRWPAAVMIACVYATSPEVFVRSSYGGYFAIGGLLGILILFGLHRRGAAAGRVDVASSLAALADHKVVLLPAAIGVCSALACLRGRGRRGIAACPTAAGFGLGTLGFWSWGAAIAPAAFLQDHVGHHLIDRLRHLNPLGYAGYPSPAALWIEFSRNTGYLLLPVGLALLVLDLAGRGAGSRPLPGRSVWLAWILLAGASFTVVDWRMTKHLAPILVPLSLGLLADPEAPAWRRAVPWAVSAFLLPWNAWKLWGLFHDFASFAVTPSW